MLSYKEASCCQTGDWCLSLNRMVNWTSQEFSTHKSWMQEPAQDTTAACSHAGYFLLPHGQLSGGENSDTTITVRILLAASQQI